MDQAACAVEGCDGTISAKKFCKKHYMEWYRKGFATPRTHEPRPETCTLAECGRKHHSQGYCGTHYRRWRKTGDPGPAKIGSYTSRGTMPTTCTGPECDKPVRSQGLCPAHYYQQHAGYELTPIRTYMPKGVPCVVEDCEKPSKAEGMCQQHRIRFLRRMPDWDAPIRTPAPPGSGHINEDGYRIIYVDGRVVREHRHEIQQLLGRPLLPTETVHHVNGARHENRTDGPLVMDERGRLRSGNLELWSHAQPAGQEIGPKLEYARQILALYGSDAEQEQYADHLEAALAVEPSEALADD
jgi:hypothetical protein